MVVYRFIMRIGAIKLVVLLVLLDAAFAGMQSMEIMEPLLSKIRVGKLKQKEDPVETVNSTSAANGTTTAEATTIDVTTVKLEPQENSTTVTSIDQTTEMPKESSTTVAP